VQSSGVTVLTTDSELTNNVLTKLKQEMPLHKGKKFAIVCK
jgi:hypothetical protein